MRAVADVGRSPLTLTAADIALATRLLAGQQPMHDETRAVHAAGFYVPGKRAVKAREDVGRHRSQTAGTGRAGWIAVSAAKARLTSSTRPGNTGDRKKPAVGGPVAGEGTEHRREGT